MNKNANTKKKKQPVFSKFTYIALILCLVIGYLLGFFTKPSRKEPISANGNIAMVREYQHKFISPLLDCEDYEPSLLKNHIKLQSDISDYVNDALKTGIAQHISVYFRALKNGPWIGVNEDYYFTPASLLKVPILIATLKEAETDTTFLNKKILYHKQFMPNVDANVVDSITIKIGKTYTINELCERMIIHSDNEAKELLLSIVGENFLVSTMTDLGVNLKNRDWSVDFISVKEYSSFFRILYNASYLNHDMSEKALEMLSRTVYNKGIKAKLPKDLQVSHKFGERGTPDSDSKQLHDCGIVYVPDAPYLLCVMTKGKDFDQLTKIISDISELVYKNVTE